MGKDYPQKTRDGEIQKLKRRVKKLETENKRLKSELKSFEQAFQRTSNFLRDHTKEITIEGLIDAAKKGHSLKETQNEEVKKACRKCLAPELTVIKNNFGSIFVCQKCGEREVEKK